MSCILVTGASGFIGRKVLDALARDGITVVAPSRSGHGPGGVRMDIEDEASVFEAFRAHRPDGVIHLAAQASQGEAASRPEAAWRVNFDGTRHLARAAASLGKPVRFVFLSTVQVYGRAFARGVPLHETDPILPSGTYARTKAAAEMMLADHLGGDADLVVLRASNQIGPGQDAQYVASSFARQFAEIEAGRRAPTLTTGNLDVERDFLDVRDLVTLVDTIVRSPLKAGARTFNVGRGSVWPVRRIVEHFQARIGRPVEIQRDPGLVRPTDMKTMAIDIAAARTAFGFEPSRSFEATLDDLLDDWRARVSSV